MFVHLVNLRFLKLSLHRAKRLWPEDLRNDGYRFFFLFFFLLCFFVCVVVVVVVVVALCVFGVRGRLLCSHWGGGCYLELR